MKSKQNLLWSFLKGSKRYFFIGIIAALLMTLCDMMIPQMIRTTVDSLIGKEPLSLPKIFMGYINNIGGRDYLRSHLYIIAIIIIVLALLGAFFRWFSTYENTKGGEVLVKTMHDQLYDHITHLPYKWHMSHSTGDIIQRCTSDVQIIKEFCALQLYNLISTILLISLALFFMATMHIKLTLITLLFVPIIVGYSSIFHIKIRDQFTLCDENEGLLSTITQENLTGVRVIRAFGREAHENEKFQHQNNIYTNTWMKLCEYLSIFWAMGDLVSGLQVMIVVLLGAYFCIQGSMSVGSYIAFISYNNMLVGPIRSLGRMISEMSKTGVSLRRISDIMMAEAETDDASVTPLTDDNTDISFEHVSFAFDQNQVLKDINMHVKQGETIGILGSTGSGKSTLMHLLCRLYDLGEGRITIGGRDIKSIPLEELRKKIGIVLQDPFLFSRTIKENITITGHEERLDEVVDIACLRDTIDSFPDGYDTMVGERGVTLSGGQIQRIAIARMLAGRPEIMIFDDSLSAIDAKTDSMVRHNLKESLSSATVFLISHRISTLMNADHIYVFESGRIIESGTHETLLKENGIYAKIYEHQSLSIEDEEAMNYGS